MLADCQPRPDKIVDRNFTWPRPRCCVNARNGRADGIRDGAGTNAMARAAP